MGFGRLPGLIGRLGTAARHNVGTGAGDIPVLDSSSRLPAVDGSQLTNLAASPIPSGTLMLFQQSSAPTGWTKATTHNDKALRVVSGSASSGGSSAFSTVFGKTQTDAHTLTSSQVPQTTTALVFKNKAGSGDPPGDSISEQTTWSGGATYEFQNTYDLANNGAGGSHPHPMDIRVQYVDVIIASKD